MLSGPLQLKPRCIFCRNVFYIDDGQIYFPPQCTSKQFLHLLLKPTLNCTILMFLTVYITDSVHIQTSLNEFLFILLGIYAIEKMVYIAMVPYYEKKY